MRLLYRVGRVSAFVSAQAFCAERVFGLHHVPRCGAVLLASNHQSFLDPLLVTCILPRECHYMARDTLFRNKYFARLLGALNAFPIKRATADIAGVRETLRRLKGGALVLTFPEGTRSSDGRILPFQPGTFTIARKAGVAVIPVAVEGAYDAWPRSGKFPRPARVWVEYGPPTPADVIANCEIKQIAVEFTARVRALHNGLRRRIGRKPFAYDDLQ